MMKNVKELINKTKVAAGNNEAREKISKNIVPLRTHTEFIDGLRDTEGNKVSIDICSVDNLEVATYLAGKWQNAKGETKNLSPMAIKAMYVVQDIIGDKGEIVHAIIMDKKLAENDSARKIVASYCYYVEHPEDVDDDIAFRIVGNTFQSTKDGPTIMLEYGRKAEMLAFAQTAKNYGHKFTGWGFGPIKLGTSLHEKMERTNEEKILTQMAKDGVKDKKIAAKIQKKSNKAGETKTANA